MKRKRIGCCPYCGERGVPLEREHVIPKCIYPESYRGRLAKLVVVYACKTCNRGWSDDEAHFRSIVALAGDSNPAVKELWGTKMTRSFNEKDGPRRVREIVEQCERVQLNGQDRLILHPGRDRRVVRVIRKIVRGLSHYHGIESAVSDDRILVEVLGSKLLEDTLEFTDVYRSYAEIVWYGYRKDETTAHRSIWILTFFERLTFVALVSEKIG